MIGGAASTIPVGSGVTPLVIPNGWSLIEVGMGAVTDQVIDGAACIGIAEDAAADPASRGFAANVLIYLGHPAIGAPADDFGPGVIWHDADGVDPLLRCLVRLVESLSTSLVVVHAWTVVEGQDLTVVATLPTARLDDLWPTVNEVLEPLLDGPASAWSRIR